MSLCHDFEKWTMISLGLVAISLTFGLVLIAHGQTFPYFEYSSYYLDDMTIRYPQDWVYREYSGTDDDYITEFIPSSEVSFKSNLSTSLPDMYSAVVIGKQRYLPYRNMPLDLYFDYEKKLLISQGFNITSTGKTNLSDGTPAYEIQRVTNNSTEKAVTVIMNKNGESYYFIYSTTPDKFNTYLPIAQQMFKTLSFRR